MGLRLFFKGSGEGYVSRIRLGIRWTHVVISRGQKLTTTNSKDIINEANKEKKMKAHESRENIK